MPRAPEPIDEDAPMTLAEAAQTVLRGVVKVATLRAAVERGDLTIERLGRVHVVTPRAIRDWRERCRAPAKAPASMPIGGEASGSSAMDLRSVEQAALLQTVAGLTKPCKPISRPSSQSPSAAIVPLRSLPARS